jgi:hypothetical protein
VAFPRRPPRGVSAKHSSDPGDGLFARDSDEPPTFSSGLSPRTIGLAGAGLCIVAAILLYPQLRHLDSVPNLGDPLFSIWRIGWVYRQLGGDPRPLFDANIFHPEPLTLTYSDSMLLPALMAAPLLAGGVHPVVAYNLLFMSGLVLSGVAAFLLARSLTGSPRAAFISGLVFGFYPYHFDHDSHLELQMMQWMPLAMLALHRFVLEPRFRYALAAVMCVAVQLYSAMYYAVFLTMYAAAVACTLMLWRPALWRRIAIPAAGALLIGAGLAIPVMRPYMAAAAVKGERTVAEVSTFSATPADYLRPHPRSALYGSHTLLPGRQPERALFPGLFPLAMATIGLVPPIGMTRVAYVVGLLVAFDGSLGFNGVSYPYLYKWLSPIRGLRVPARYSVLVALSLAVLSGYGARRLLARQRAAGGRLIFAALITAATIDAWPRLRLQPLWLEPPAIYRALGDVRKVVLAEFPIPRDFAGNTPYMYFSFWHGAAMVNGYSGFMPPSYTELVENLRGFPAPRTIEALKSRGVTHITVNCAFYAEGCQQILRAVDDVRDFRRIAEARWQGHTVRLYELTR